MNLLLENGLPEEIDGRPIYPDFRNMIRFEQLLQDDTLPPHIKLMCSLQQLFERVPEDLDYAVQKLLWFYNCGKSPKDAAGGRAGMRPPERAYDFDKDAPLIYASFVAAYGMHLTEVDYLHWWEFTALLQSLPDTTPMGRVMYLRTVDLDTIKDKTQRKILAEQKDHWRLKPLHTPPAGRSIAELEQAARDQTRRRLEQARMEQARLKAQREVTDHV